MTKKRYFKDSKDYFKFINKNKNLIDVILVKPLGKSIKVTYEKKKTEIKQFELFDKEGKNELC